MAYSEYLVERIREKLRKSNITEEKKMMGGYVFMVNHKMCLGIDQDKKTNEDRLMVRTGKETYEKLLQKSGAREMDFTGKSMKGFIFVYSEGIDSDEDLSFWIEAALSFNRTLK